MQIRSSNRLPQANEWRFIFMNRVIPSFEQLYPDKKAIFFIDQAPFHINRVAFPRSDCNKKEIAKHYEHHIV